LFLAIVPGTVKNNILAFARQSVVNSYDPYSFNTVPLLPEFFTASNNLFYFDRNGPYPVDYTLPKGSPGAGFVVFDPSQAGRSNPILKPPVSQQDVSSCGGF